MKFAVKQEWDVQGCCEWDLRDGLEGERHKQKNGTCNAYADGYAKSNAVKNERGKYVKPG